MDKRMRPSPVDSFRYAPVRRQTDPQSLGSGGNSAGHRPSAGYPYSRRFSQVAANDSTDHVLNSRTDDDLPLDAFDRELLSQLNEEQQKDHFQTSLTPVPRPMATSRPNVFRTPAPKQTSRFFEKSTGSRTTPLRSLESSSSEPGPPSSPLIVFGSRGRLDSSLENSLPITNSPHWSSAPQSHRSTNPSSKESSTISSGHEVTRQISLHHAPPSIQGISLVSVHELPDSFRSLFPFPIFNAIQSKCFRHVYHNDYNVVLAAPTGSGKTVVMELAICRLVNSLKDGQFKVVYQAPTKSLCTERFRDWTAKFTPLGLNCAELTGDTDYAQLKSVQNASIIITTPEKWDSMTRKWKDHARLMQLVKLFLIDEVHILKEARGATLEAVVSRMKSVGSDVRFIALSATVPNSEDIASWLGKDATNEHLPAHRERFGEEFRPVKLQKFVYGYQSNGNDFAFDKVCATKLPEIIAKHSCNKPIMIFCCTRNSSIATAKELANLYAATNPPRRMWKGPDRCIEVQHPDLKTTVISGVAFHHAGLDSGDRHAVETGFLGGQIGVICCTSTLAVGVNLPCHLVIIKNTVGWQDGGCKEYSDLEMMQMLGRAGRPQFDDSAVAVILTRKERVHHYEKLVSGSECLESCLHLNLIDHLNAEIGLGTVTDIESATRWLAGTFLFVRLRRNPTHYKLREGADKRDEDEMLRQICEKDVKLLQNCFLVSSEGKLKSTQFGDAMARYYVKFETMKLLLSLQSKAKMSEILSAIVQAEEFRDIRLKSGEKSLYKEINRANGIKFPIKVDVALPAHKISLLIQSELGAVEFPTAEQFQKHRLSFQQDKNFVFSHVTRLIRCVIDCQIYLEDSIAARNALELARSFGARVWDNSPLQMKQIDQIGIVAVRKLSAAGITSLEALELTEAHQIDMVLSRNPPFGVKVLAKLGDFPKLRVTVKMMGKETKPGKPVRVNFKADIGFMNEKAPLFFQRRPVYVCFLAETSDGHMIDFRRMNANKLQNGYEIFLHAELKSAFQHITCYVMCDDIGAGTMRHAELKPDIPAALFPATNLGPEPKPPRKPIMNSSRRRSSDICQSNTVSHGETEEFDGDNLQIKDFVTAAESAHWVSVDDEPAVSAPERQSKARKPGEVRNLAKAKTVPADDREEPTQLPNRKWACNHKCKDKSTCKHFCCREGLEKPPKISKKQVPTGENQKGSSLNQLTLSATLKKDVPPARNDPKPGKKRESTDSIELLDLTQLRSKQSSNVNRKPIDEQQQQSSRLQYTNGSFIDLDDDLLRPYGKLPSSDYGDSSLDDLPSPSALLREDMETTGGGCSKEMKHQSTTKLIEDGAVSNESLIGLDDAWLLSQSDIYNDDLLQEDIDGKDTIRDITGSAEIIQSEEQDESLVTLNSAFGSREGQRHSPFLKTSSDPMLTQSPEPEVINGQKRAALVFEENEDHDNGYHKRPRQDNSTTSNQESFSVQIEPVNVINTKDQEPAPIPEGWEGIDPSLLEEFKDIVNFF